MCRLEDVNKCRRALGLEEKKELDFLNEDGTSKFKRTKGKYKVL